MTTTTQQSTEAQVKALAMMQRDALVAQARILMQAAKKIEREHPDIAPKAGK